MLDGRRPGDRRDDHRSRPRLGGRAAAPALGGFEESEDEEAWWDERAEPIEAAVEAGEIERAQDLLLEIWAPLGVDDPAGERIRAIARDNIHELTMDESGAEPLDPPAAQRLAEIDTPVLVLERAARSTRRAPAPAQLIAREVLDGRLVTIDADHVVNLRAPEAFDAAVLPFLAGARAPRSRGGLLLLGLRAPGTRR